MFGAFAVCRVSARSAPWPLKLFPRRWQGSAAAETLRRGSASYLVRTSKMGQRDIRRLLIIGAMSVVRWRSQNGSQPGSWLARMLARKPKMLVAIALANKMARAVWAMLTREEDYQVPKGEVC